MPSSYVLVYHSGSLLGVGLLIPPKCKGVRRDLVLAFGTLGARGSDLCYGADTQESPHNEELSPKIPTLLPVGNYELLLLKMQITNFFHKKSRIC